MQNALMSGAPIYQNPTFGGGLADGGASSLLGGPQGPMGGMGAPAPQMPTQQELQDAQGHLGRMIPGLLSLTSKPMGQLTRGDVFNSAADMIKGGSYSTPDQQQALVSHLAGLPEDEGQLRQIIGQHLLSASMMQQHVGNLLNAS